MPAAQSQSTTPPPPVLRIGVTGHRDLGDRAAAIEGLARARLAEWWRAHADARFEVLSALAEGADRLVARLAVEMLAARLVVCLPMPREAYARDFATAASQAEFEALLGQALRIDEAPLLSVGEAWRDWSEERNHQYAWAGAWVAAKCDLLIAIWDGKPARGTGGTADVVAWFRGGRAPERYGIAPAGAARGQRWLAHINSVSLASDLEAV